MQQVFTDESLTRADRASRLISGRDVLFGAAQTTKQYHADGYVNVLNQYGTQNDTTEQYEYSPDGGVMDVKLTQMYEGDGLFAKIIDTPADECVKHGFSFSNLSDEKAESFLRSALDDLDWEDCFSTAVKWSRLFGGAIGVMLIDDGGELDEPLNWSAIKSIDEIRIYERAIVQPDYTSLYRINPQYDGNSHIQSKFGMPQYYTIMSQYGSFVVHESRCLIFRNGRLPERTSNPLYQIWGMPEYIRIKRSMRDATIAHGDATKLLERSVQAVYSMKGLADECSTEEGENRILKRLQTIDTSRGLMNTISIDADGENYDFKTFSFSGVSDVVDTSCNMLSALTNIPQTILFGRSPAGMSATGESDMENYYNFVGRIQKTQLRQNFQILLDVIVQAGVHSGELDKAPDIHIEFNPLWSLSDAEQAQVEATKAATASTRANTAIAYVNSQILDPTEVRRKLAESGEFNVEDIITEDDIDEDDILKAMNAPTQQSANPTVEGELANKPQQLQQQNQPPEQPDNQTSSKPKLLTKGHFSKYSDGESSRHSWDSVDADGGPGSGNFNHGGRPGEIGGSSPSLSDAEVKSIVRYTGTNEHLSDEDKCNIESAIKKSPPLDPELSYHRGLALKPSELKDFIEKGIYEPKDLTSWSNSESVAYNRCADLNWGDKVNVILSYNGKKQLDNGISVTEWSQNPDEDEVIFGSGAKMRIAKDEIYGIDEETGTADPESTVYINLYDDENADSTDFNSDYDKPAKDLDWITVNGTHTPLQEGKAIGGGKLSGRDFSRATSQKRKKTEQKGPLSSKQPRKVVNASNISKSFKPRSAYKYEIDDIINAQGFDALPHVVSQSEFDEAVKESGFVAQRVYCAPSKEILDAYHEQLVNGQFYVNCEVGGAQYGQGMYCASDYSGNLSEGIGSEIAHYKEEGQIRGMPYSRVETITLDKSAKIADYRDLIYSFDFFNAKDSYEKYMLASNEYDAKKHRYAQDKLSAVEEIAFNDIVSSYDGPAKHKELAIAWLKSSRHIGRAKEPLDDIAKLEKENPSELKSVRKWVGESGGKISAERIKAIPGVNKETEAHFANTREPEPHDFEDDYDSPTYKDLGVFAAACGYDAIKADGHGESGSYTVILNRSKIIVKGDENA